MGLVLLDVGDGVERAVELEAGHAGGDPAREDVGSGFQLHAGGAEFSGVAGELLTMSV